MGIPEGADKRIFFPIKNNDPFTLLEGQFGITDVATGSKAYYRPHRTPAETEAGDPVPDPILFGTNVTPQNSVGEVPAGLINGSNTVFTTSQDVQNPATALLDVNGVLRQDLTIVGDTITLDFAPAAGSSIYIVFGISLTGGVSTFNGRSGTVLPLAGDYPTSLTSDDSDWGGPTTKDSLNASKAAVGSLSSPSGEVVNVASFQATAASRILYVDRTVTGECAIEISSALIALAQVDLIIIDRGANASINKIIITTEGAETINGDSAGAEIIADRGVVRLLMDGNNVHITGGAA